MNRRRPAGSALVAVCAAVCGFAALLAAGCVETAECDESTRCAAGKVCYEYRCRPRCLGDDDCDESAACAPCGSDEESPCIGVSDGSVGACVSSDQPS